MGETKSINKLTFKFEGDDYELYSSGGSLPGPNTVGTEQIIDDSVELEDLNTEVKQKFTHSYDAENEGILLGGLVGEPDAATDTAADDGEDDV